MTPAERKKKILELREKHVNVLKNKKDSIFLPKMAYKPSGRDELCISFFPSELKKGKHIYTEFVDINYNPEDTKRALYLLKHNPNWESDYDKITSNSGYEWHIVPVKKLISMNTFIKSSEKIELISPDERDIVDVLIGIEKALLKLNKTMESWHKAR